MLRGKVNCQELLEKDYIPLHLAVTLVDAPKEDIRKAMMRNEIRWLPGKISKPDKVLKPDLIKKFPIKEDPKGKCLGLVAAAKFLNISRLQFYKLIEDGTLKTKGEGFDVKIPVSELEKVKRVTNGN